MIDYYGSERVLPGQGGNGRRPHLTSPALFFLPPLSLPHFSSPSSWNLNPDMTINNQDVYYDPTNWKYVTWLL